MNQIHITPMVKKLIISCVSIWLVGQIILEGLIKIPFSSFLMLSPIDVIYHFQIWQLFTYLFLHAPSEVNHILFNMLMLWFMGAELETHWGPKFFIKYYLICGVGAGIVYCLVLWLTVLVTGNVNPLAAPVLGASGALYGLIYAYGVIFSERMILFMMVFPMKAKHFALLLGFIQFVSLLSMGGSGNVAFLAHLGGLAVGFVYLRGRDWIKRFKWNRQKGPKLRLVVDNEKDPLKSKEPKYWN